jgi:hypothetical protein
LLDQQPAIAAKLPANYPQSTLYRKLGKLVACFLATIMRSRQRPRHINPACGLQANLAQAWLNFPLLRCPFC